MALQIDLDFNGMLVSGSYARIGEAYWNQNDRNTFHLRIDFYASQQAFTEGKDAISSQRYTVSLPLEDPTNEFTQIFNQIRALGYVAMKQLEPFQGAIDA